MLKLHTPTSRMRTDTRAFIDKLARNHRLEKEEYLFLLENASEEEHTYAAKLADEVRRKIYGTDVFIRGLIEVGSICRNDCYYCGIRASNGKCIRYTLSDEQIFSCCKEGYALGFRSFVLQGGEGALPMERIIGIVSEIRKNFSECTITLSLGEYERDEYEKMFRAGANRYLLRHETADEPHYRLLHPTKMSWKHRMQCLKSLREVGFAVGCGFMVGSPFQTFENIASDLKFIEEFSPEMCGIGPFIPQRDTPLGGFSAGSVNLTCYLLSLIRLIKPKILLPATTALGSAEAGGRLRGILAGANVVMPNLSPFEVRGKYNLYDNKLSTGSESAQNLEELKKSLGTIGFSVAKSRGDIKNI